MLFRREKIRFINHIHAHAHQSISIRTFKVELRFKIKKLKKVGGGGIGAVQFVELNLSNIEFIK